MKLIHEEFVKVLQGRSSIYRTGSDRVNNAEDYLWRHSAEMVDFESPELHPDAVKMWRNKARGHQDRRSPSMGEAFGING